MVSQSKSLTKRMEIGMPAKNNSIYHYCQFETAKEILSFKQLLLNPIDKTNDPRENQEFLFASTYFEKDIEEFRTRRNEISRALREGCKVISFSQDHNPYFGCELSSMWAHYGGNHKGLCLEIDKNSFLEENEALIDNNLLREVQYFHLDLSKSRKHTRVDYSEIKRIGLKNYIERFRLDHLQHLYYTKNAEWEWEREVRLIHFSDEKSNEYCSIKRSLINIHVGVEFDHLHIKSIRELIPSVNIYQMKWKDVRLCPELIPS